VREDSASCGWDARTGDCASGVDAGTYAATASPKGVGTGTHGAWTAQAARGRGEAVPEQGGWGGDEDEAEGGGTCGITPSLMHLVAMEKRRLFARKRSMPRAQNVRWYRDKRRRWPPVKHAHYRERLHHSELGGHRTALPKPTFERVVDATYTQVARDSR